jgi:hypothetical protein
MPVFRTTARRSVQVASGLFWGAFLARVDVERALAGRGDRDMRKTLLASAVFALVLVAYVQRTAAPTRAARATTEHGSSSVTAAFENHSSGVEVQGEGRVAAILPDDVDGSRHQRFLVRLDAGPTVLIAHNIDLAPRVPSLRAGDRISFSGEYIWNPQGGLIHWTHRDPAGHHEAGWLKHKGETFQ